MALLPAIPMSLRRRSCIRRQSTTRLEPAYAWRLHDLRIVAAGVRHDHPVKATLVQVEGTQVSRLHTVTARYVIGCDGARSRVRECLGRTLHGDSANQAWGVMDVLAVTDFPDIRLKSVIHSAAAGNMLLIPREGGYMVRLYIELDKLADKERVADRQITAERLVATAQRILAPWALAVKEIAWWSVYEIGQRLCQRFDDLPDDNTDTRGEAHGFIAGDACHTHSPKAGQGMNVSMGDAYNLGWKLAAVLLGRASPALRRTCSNERQAVARELIDFDREFARLFSARPKLDDEGDGEAVDPAEFQRYFVRHGRYTAGTAIAHRPSLISATPRHQHLATGFPIGMRFHSAPVIRLADARPLQLDHTIKADGRWRLFVFAATGDSGGHGSVVRALCDHLGASPASPLRRYTRANDDSDAVIDMRAIFQRAHRALHAAACLSGPARPGEFQNTTRVRASMLSRGMAVLGACGFLKPVCGVQAAWRPAVESQFLSNSTSSGCMFEA